MADHGTVKYETAAGNDYKSHEESYELFLKLVKWHVILIPILLALMAYFLV
jgi:Bacterial aa3 type cytochrome c oxidase subunit IV